MRRGVFLKPSFRGLARRRGGPRPLPSLRLEPKVALSSSPWPAPIAASNLCPHRLTDMPRGSMPAPSMRSCVCVPRPLPSRWFALPPTPFTLPGPHAPTCSPASRITRQSFVPAVSMKHVPSMQVRLAGAECEKRSSRRAPSQARPSVVSPAHLPAGKAGALPSPGPGPPGEAEAASPFLAARKPHPGCLIAGEGHMGPPAGRGRCEQGRVFPARTGQAEELPQVGPLGNRNPPGREQLAGRLFAPRSAGRHVRMPLCRGVGVFPRTREPSLKHVAAHQHRPRQASVEKRR